ALFKDRYEKAVSEELYIIMRDINDSLDPDQDLFSPEGAFALSDLLSSRAALTEDLSYFFFADNDKRVIAHSDSSLNDTYLNEKEYPDLRFEKGEKRYLLHFRKYYEAVIPFYVSGSQAGTIHAGFKDIIIKREIHKIYFQNGIILLLILLVIWVGNSYLLSRMIVKPINEFSDKIKNILETGNLNQKINIPRSPEIEELSLLLSRMLSKLYFTTISRDFFDTIIESIDDMILVTDREGYIKSVNRSTISITGLKPENILGSQVRDVFSESKKSSIFEEKTFLKFARQGYIKNLNIHFKTNLEEEVPVSLTGSVMHDLEGAVIGIVLVARDLRELQQLIAELNEIKNDYEEKSRRLERFNRLMVGRELEMVNLKKKINELLVKSGITEKYKLPGEKGEENE
ncbi:MAG TPA: PAS domain S-box protein, partial [Firmicutes bacterium]|nr:PAS domain S-box protein [Bacillota bacterium]